MRNYTAEHGVAPACIGSAADYVPVVPFRVHESAARATEGAARVAARADADAREAVHGGGVSDTEAELLRIKVWPQHVSVF